MKYPFNCQLTLMMTKLLSNHLLSYKQRYYPVEMAVITFIFLKHLLYAQTQNQRQHLSQTLYNLKERPKSRPAPPRVCRRSGAAQQEARAGRDAAAPLHEQVCKASGGSTL